MQSSTKSPDTNITSKPATSFTENRVHPWRIGCAGHTTADKQHNSSVTYLHRQQHIR